MKRRYPTALGTLETPNGCVRIKDPRIAATLEGLQKQAQKMRDGWADEHAAHERTRESYRLACDQLRVANERLARLQNRVWVRLGEALRIIRP